MKKSKMHKLNWVFLGISIFLVYFGFFMMRSITRNYDGLYAFVSICVTIAGIVGSVLSLAIRFDKDDESEKI